MQDAPTPGNQTAPGSALTTPSLPEPEGAPATARQTTPVPPVEVRYTGFDLWLHRVTMLLLVFVCAVVGVLLVIMPWRPEWTDNHLLLPFPGLRAFVASGFVRGICSGLGLLDIWIGFWEAIHYHEIKHH
jgi:hypothetical protein